ncbi:MAG: DNA repair protein RecN [Pseudomonadota bacterium]|nr:DNA repair protein RecN [Pseudomonadota bacterium]
MLVSLSVRDIVLIDRLDLTFGDGLCALTGETGAGKSILLDALGLALGTRGDSGLLRRGVDQATVTAAFEPPSAHPVWRLLDDHGLGDGERLMLRRVLGADGRARAFVNDQPVGVALMREIGDSLVEIQGQANKRGLLSAETHRVFLDGFGGLDGDADDVAKRHEKWRAAATALAEAETRLAESRRDEEYLRHVLAELDDLSPVAGEETNLADRRTVLMQGEKLGEALAAARGELTEGRGVDDRIGTAQRLVLRTAERAPEVLDGVIEALDRALIETAEAMAALDAASRDLAPDPERLEATEQRLFALRAAARKHNTDVDSLAALRDDFAARIATLEGCSEALETLTKVANNARKAFARAACRLSKKRAKAARELDRQVIAELPHLKLDRVVFETGLEALDEDDWSAQGAERVSFAVATNPGDEPGAIGRIASGGELSRLMLALKVVLTRVGATPTLVFDEVDSGIGGAAAAAVGERLAGLGESFQVLVVTHSPQVAARADHHFRVVKKDRDQGALTRVEPLENDSRREEVARMLAGAEITDEARAAADSLMHGATG